MQGSARKDVVFGAARVYTFTVPGPKWKSWVATADEIQAVLERAKTFDKGGLLFFGPAWTEFMLDVGIAFSPVDDGPLRHRVMRNDPYFPG